MDRRTLMYHTHCTMARFSVAAAALALCTTAGAAPLNVTVKVENLAPTNSISFAPLHFGFNNGSFDAFDNGAVATAPIISVAEGGSGSAWQPAFAAADPTATRGTIGGLLQPGESRSSSFLVDPLLNPFFTFAAMVVPSNDFFIGNDSPTRLRFADPFSPVRRRRPSPDRLDRPEGPRPLGRRLRAVRSGSGGLRRQQ